jgi:hypothetical protein
VTVGLLMIAVCENDSVCDALMPEKKDGVCYKGGVTVKQNYQQCDVVSEYFSSRLGQRRISNSRRPENRRHS